LPTRSEVIARLRQRWAEVDGAERAEAITLHYFAGELSAEVRISLVGLDDLVTLKRLAKQLREAALLDPDIVELTVLFG
jgi:hypothetical protein